MLLMKNNNVFRMSATTHPGYAALAGPLSGYAAKRVLKIII
ncbi:hypothetical protein SAMN05428947_10251 [Mucilaginibacter sp. OK283]|jgi:hypothetical protein|nr:hypothetical protein SAMN05428947_10251 [Mucilaginibacter sp. OK283]